METIEGLSVNDSLEITIGLPTWGPRRRITQIKGPENSLNLKKSIVTIENDDKLCMARAIGFEEVYPRRMEGGDEDQTKRTYILPSRTRNYYKHLTQKNRKEQGQLAVTLCQTVGVPQDKPANLNDIPAFENVLGGRVIVVSARLGNKFITNPSIDERPCIYLYLVATNTFTPLPVSRASSAPDIFVRNA